MGDAQGSERGLQMNLILLVPSSAGSAEGTQQERQSADLFTSQPNQKPETSVLHPAQCLCLLQRRSGLSVAVRLCLAYMASNTAQPVISGRN